MGMMKTIEKGVAAEGSRMAAMGAAALGAVGTLASYDIRRTRQDEREHPPVGRFIDVDGARLHYIDRGKGDVVTLIHGNFTLAEDFLLSGIIDKLAERCRVLVFDRPGFGCSDRPHRLWTPGAYAALLQKAFAQLDVGEVTVVTHPFASLIGLELALEHPALVKGLALEEGWPLDSHWILASVALYFLVGACWLLVVWLQTKMARIAETSKPARRCRRNTGVTFRGGSRWDGRR